MTLFLREAQKIDNLEAAKLISYTRLAMNGDAQDVQKVMRDLQDGM